MQATTDLHTIYVCTQIIAQLNPDRSCGARPNMGLPASLRDQMDFLSDDLYTHDRTIMKAFLKVLWIFYLNPLEFKLMGTHRTSLLRVARKLYYDNFMKRVRMLSSGIGDKASPVEQFTKAFLQHFDGLLPSTISEWANQLDGLDLYELHTHILNIAYEISDINRPVYTWPSYGGAKTLELTRELYILLEEAGSSLCIESVRSVHTFVMNYLQIVRLPHIRPLLDECIHMSMRSNNENIRMLAYYMTYRLCITICFDYTDVASAEQRMYEAAISAMVDQPPPSRTFVTAREHLHGRTQIYT